MSEPIAIPAEAATKDRLRITEIFFSIQGESTHQGLPCAMVRLTGCNLRCTWCDSEYSFYGGRTMTIDEVVTEVHKFPTRRVEITGGEPLLQRAVRPLSERFLSEGYVVLCETSGERDIDILPEGVLRIVDLKPPGSGESAKNLWTNIEKLRSGDEVKFVLQDRVDFDWMVDVVRKHALLEKTRVQCSPVHERLEPRELAEWILASGLELRLNLQLHKVLWGNAPGH